jgi:hypothetical protein
VADAPEPAVDLTDPAAMDLLTHGRLEVEGRLVDASNVTLFCKIELDGVVSNAVYKPVSGEKPLWDFPDGTLAEREVAAFTVSQAAGGNLIPPTVLREGPFGIGMVQLWIQAEDSMDIRHLLRAGGPELRRVALLDAVINNGDRKGGHLLPIGSGHVYGIDHGVSFNVEEKLRTVLWNWAGDGLTDDEIQMLEQLRGCFDDQLSDELEELLTRAEVRRTRHRIERLLRTGTLPMPSRDWPPVPWPAM